MNISRSRTAGIFGWGAYVTVLIWYALSLRANVLVGGRFIWIPSWSFLGLDFLHDYHAANHWLAGGNPYTEPFGDPFDRVLLYPPPVLPLFAWCRFVSALAATRIWFIASLGTAVICTISVWRERVRAGRTQIPLGFLCALALCTTPFIFEIERGNCNVLALALVFGAGTLLETSRRETDMAAGAMLALATSIKLYPGIAILVLVAFGLHTALLAFVGSGLLLLGFSLPLLPGYFANAFRMVEYHPANDVGGVRTLRVTHTLTGYWEYLQNASQSLRIVPGLLIAIVAIVVPLCIALWSMRGRPAPRSRLRPTVLVVVGAGTFIPPVAYDYSLIFIVVALMALWDHRRHWFFQGTVVISLIWLQPFALPLGLPLLYASKYALVLALAWALAHDANASPRNPTGIDNARSDNVVSSSLLNS